MAPAGILVLLGAALLLSSGGNCDICPAVREDANTFVNGTLEDYLNIVKTYKDDSLTLQNAEKLKTCVDGKLSQEDKANAINLLGKIYDSPYC